MVDPLPLNLIRLDNLKVARVVQNKGILGESPVDEMDLEVNLAPRHPDGLKLINPVMIASGTFGWDGLGSGLPKMMKFDRLGAIVLKTTTLTRRHGNPTPRIIHGQGWTLNSIGLENPGIEDVLELYARNWVFWNVPVILSISGERLSEFESLADFADGVAGVAALEINVSCPNVEGGLEFGQRPDLTFRLTQLVKAATSLPIIVKLSPNVTEIGPIAIAASEGGADALTLTNTLKGMSIDFEKNRSKLGTTMGGVSGHALRPIALGMVYTVCQVVTIPVIGVGGISTAAHAMEYFAAGASAVQVGSANFVDQFTPLNVLEGLRSHFRLRRISSLNQVIGSAHR